MIPLLLTHVALAGAPTRVAAVLDVGQGVEDVEVASDGSAVALSDEGGGKTWVLDVGTWSLVEVTPCGSPAGLVSWPGSASRFWVGCIDGSVGWLDFEDGKVVQTSEPVAVSEAAVLGLTASSDTVFVLAENPTEGAAPQVYAVSAEDEKLVAGDGFPALAGTTGFEDIAYSGTAVYVTHGGAQMTRMEGESGAASLQQETLGGGSTGDILPTVGSYILVAGGSGGVLQYEAGANRLTPLMNFDDGVDDASALAWDAAQGFFLVADEDAGGFLRFSASASTGFPTGEVEDTLDFPAGGKGVTEMGVIDGYIIAGTSSGEVWVLTDRPWVEAEAATPASALSGTEVSVDFVADVDGSWSARLNADTNGDGAQLTKGTLKASEVQTTTFTVDGDFREGTNRVRIVVTSEEGQAGHDTTEVFVDNPPSTVSLKSKDVGFGDQLIEIDINGISDEDLVRYTIYVSTVDFSSEEYAAGGPGFIGAPGDSGAKALDLPRKVSAEPGQDKQITIAPLTNGVTYYVAVRATDEAGQEGPMSRVVSAKPQETFGAADLAGETGGMSCSSTGAGTAGLIGMLGALFLGLTRRSAFLAVSLFLVGLPAHAQDEWPQAVKTWDQIKGGTFELRYGPTYFSDDSITSIFGEKGNNILWVQFGPTFFDLIETKGSIGYFHGEATRISASGASSSQEDYLNTYPVAADLTARLDVLPEQPIVPFAGVGIDYWFWREIWEASGGGSGRENISGGKSGWHYSYGAHLLLDIFEPGRASKLTAVMGITDSYITVEYRVQKVGEDQKGLQFSADTLSMGLKFDH